MSQLYTPAEAAERLKVTETWLKKRVSARSIPHTRIGRHIRFSDADLAALVAQSGVSPTTTPLRRKSA